MTDLNHSQNLAMQQHAGCFHVPFLLPVLVAVVGVLVACPSQAQFTYTTNNGTVTITGYTGTDANVVIPTTIDGLPVTSIGYEALDAISLTSVTIPNSVTNIGDGAFSYCSSLTTIAVDLANQNYSSIGGVLFDKDQKTLIRYPSAKDGASYTIPNSVTGIGDSAFFFTSLTSITIPNSVTSIGGAAFSQCNGLTNVTIPSSVTNIGILAFGDASLTAITVDSANRNYSSIGGVLFDKSQKTLIQYPAANSGASYTIPDSVTNIGDSAFGGCYSLTSVTIPNSVTSIGDSAFSGSGLTSVTIGKSVTSIGNYAFVGDHSLTSVTIPNSVTSVGDSAFDDCGSLTNVTIGNSVTSIGDGAFFNCSSLANVTIPNGVTGIGDDAFAGCFSLTSVYFQGNAPSLGAFVFGGFPWSIQYPMDNATAYYLPGTTGWSMNFGGIPTALWSLPYPMVLNSSLGVRSNQFGLTVSWATNATVVVEATGDLSNRKWSALTTNALSGGTFYFTDPQWTKYPSRFYRVRSQ
jgi:hypothetical protein